LVDRAQVSAGEWVAVHGCGGVGLSAVQIATALGANVIATDIDPAKLEFATRMGAVETVLVGSADPAAAIQEITKGGAHVAVDALGIRATCRSALESLRIRGRHVQIGQTGHDEQGLIEFPIDVMIAKELSVVASQGMQASRYEAMLNMIEKGRLAPSQLITRSVTLEEAGEVMAAMDDYGTLGFCIIDCY
jgi:D-arabinose 1-dehydrogenase-like Zn-dependent alcohol dehydrogenase